MTNAFAIEPTLEEVAQEALDRNSSAIRVMFAWQGKYYSVFDDDGLQIDEMPIHRVQVTRTIRVTEWIDVPGTDSGDAEETALELMQGQRVSELDITPRWMDIEGITGRGDPCDYEAFADHIIPPQPEKQEKAA